MPQTINQQPQVSNYEFDELLNEYKILQKEYNSVQSMNNLQVNVQ